MYMKYDTISNAGEGIFISNVSMSLYKQMCKDLEFLQVVINQLYSAALTCALCFCRWLQLRSYRMTKAHCILSFRSCGCDPCHELHMSRMFMKLCFCNTSILQNTSLLKTNTNLQLPSPYHKWLHGSFWRKWRLVDKQQNGVLNLMSLIPKATVSVL